MMKLNDYESMFSSFTLKQNEEAIDNHKQRMDKYKKKQSNVKVTSTQINYTIINEVLYLFNVDKNLYIKRLL